MHHCRVIAGADGVPYAMAIAAARGSSWSFLGRVFGHFFDLGCHRGRFEKGISIFWGFEKIAFFGAFFGGFWMHRFSSWYFGKGVIGLMCCVDIHVGDGFVLGFSFGGC